MQPDPLDQADLNRICEGFAQKCRDRENPRIEDCLQGSSEPVRTALLVRLLRLEWRLRTQFGNPPDARDSVERFPDQHDLIRSLSADDESIRLTPNLRYEQGSNQITLAATSGSTRRPDDGATAADHLDVNASPYCPLASRLAHSSRPRQATERPVACIQTANH